MATPLEEARRLESLARARELERLAAGGEPIVAGPPDPLTAPLAEEPGVRQFQSRFPEGSFAGGAPEFLKPAAPGEQKRNLRPFFQSDLAKEATIATSATAGAQTGFNLPLPPNLKALAGIAGAGIGGTAAAFGFNFGGAVTEGQSLADIEFGDIAANSLKRGGEEALFEFAGQQLIKGFRIGKEALRKKVFTASDDQQLAQGLLDRAGTGLSLGRATDNAMFTFVDDALRSSPATSTMFENLELANEKAFRQLLNTESAQIAGQELRTLSPNRVGLFTIDAIKGGDSLFGKLMERHYRKLDDLVPSRLDLEAPRTGKFGEALVTGSRLVPPVDMKDSIKFATGQLDEQVTKRISQSAEGQRVLDDLADLSESSRLTFSEAHKFRSDILALKRSIPLDAVNRGQALRTIAVAEEKVSKAMDVAVQEFGTPTAKRHLKLLQKEWKTSREAFNNDFVAKVFAKGDEASKVGEWAFASDASPERITSIYKAIDKTISTSKQAVRQGIEGAKNLTVRQAAQAKKRLQGQYLRSRLATDTSDVGSSDLFKILDDPKAFDQFQAAIPDKTHQKNITDLLKAVRAGQLDTLTTGGRTILGIHQTRGAITIGAGAAGAAAGGLAGTPAGAGQEGALGGAAMSLGGLIFGTRALAKIMTDPAKVRQLTAASKVLSTDPRAGSIIARLGSELNHFLSEDENAGPNRTARAGPL